MRFLTGIGFAVAFAIACAVEGGAVSAEVGIMTVVPTMAATAWSFLRSDLCD